MYENQNKSGCFLEDAHLLGIEWNWALWFYRSNVTQLNGTTNLNINMGEIFNKTTIKLFNGSIPFSIPFKHSNDSDTNGEISTTGESSTNAVSATKAGLSTTDDQTTTKSE